MMYKRKNHGKIPWSKLHNIGSQISASWPEINAIILRYQPKVFSSLEMKEKLLNMFHPQLPLGMPCYDLAPVTESTLSRLTQFSGIPSSLGLTGGEYRARERIHRDISDSRLLVIPAS